MNIQRTWQKIGGIVLVSILCVFVLFPALAQNMEGLPVSFAPTRALVGDQISLQAIVKNTEKQRGVFTVDFVTAQGDTIGTQSGEIEKGGEKVMIVPWVMPKESTVVSVKAILFVGADGKKKELSTTIGSVTVAPSSSRQSFFSSVFLKTKVFLEKKRISWLAQVDKKRDELKDSVPDMRDRIGDALEIVDTGSLSEGEYGQTQKSLANQATYYGYGILHSVLASTTLFYAIIILFALAILKFIFGRVV